MDILKLVKEGDVLAKRSLEEICFFIFLSYSHSILLSYSLIFWSLSTLITPYYSLLLLTTLFYSLSLLITPYYSLLPLITPYEP